MPLGYFWITHWKKFAGLLAFVLVVSPFILLHLFVWLARRFEPALPEAAVTAVQLADGRALQVYRRDSPGADRTVVFIHGSPATGRAFHRQFADELPGVNLLAYDRPGYGGSSGWQAPDLATQTAALAALLEALQLTDCILVGHSYGGPVALHLALHRADLVRAVVLVGGSVDPEQEKVLWVQRLARLPWVRPLLPRAVDSCNLELLALRADLEELRPRLPGLAVPVVMVHGAHDRLVPPANVAYLEAELRAGRRPAEFTKILLADGNHFIPWQQPAAVREAIERLLTDLTPATVQD